MDMCSPCGYWSSVNLLVALKSSRPGWSVATRTLHKYDESSTGDILKSGDRMQASKKESGN